MHGLQGQQIDWRGDDGGWYDLISDKTSIQASVRLSAPLGGYFPDHQVMTAFALQYSGGHSIIIETEHPQTTHSESCLDASYAPCLAENSVRITVDGRIHPAVSMERAALPGDARITATNLPPECRPRGHDHIWAYHFPHTGRHNAGPKREPVNFIEWASGWSSSTAAPTWCSIWLENAGPEGTFKYEGKHAAFRIEIPEMTVRLHHGTSHEHNEALVVTGSEQSPSSSVDLHGQELWNMGVHVEWYSEDLISVTGILGQTMRPVLDDWGSPVPFGLRALHGEIEDYRISGPLDMDFKYNHA